jgi:PAS domain S-box-containing protein
MNVDSGVTLKKGIVAEELINGSFLKSKERSEELTNILLVDDRKEGLLAMEAVLRSPAYHLMTASSGEEALRLVDKYPFAVVLLDVQMPVMDGFETARRMVKNEKTKSIPIIFVTAINMETTHVYRGYESGAIDYLFKPFDPHILQSKVAVFVKLFQNNLKIKQQALLLREAERRDRARLLAELEVENLRRYQNLADAVPHIIWKAHPDGIASYFNEGWFQYTGLNLEQSNGRGWQAMFHPSDLKDLFLNWKKANGASLPMEMECRVKNGTDRNYYWHLLRGVSEKDSRGHLLDWILTCSNIDNRKKAEEGIQRLNQDLEKRVKERTQELQNVNEDLIRSNQELEQFSYVASHDLKEPLRKVGVYTELLARRYKGQLDENADKFINYTMDGVRRMDKLIDDLLTYSRVGRATPVQESTDLNALVDRVISDLEPTIQESGAQVTRDSLPTLMVNPSQMRQVFQNLISNGLKFRGGEPPRIHVSALQEENKWIFSVRDNGIGIDPAQFSRIFTIFQRLHPAGKYPGTGIGLSICKKIVEQSGGRIWVESEPGTGSNFQFSIPS